MDLLLDQNIPYQVLTWLRNRLQAVEVEHCQDLGMGQAADSAIFAKAQTSQAIILTFDEDFADQRIYPMGMHAGVIRLRVEPTSVEAAVDALDRLFSSRVLEELRGRLTIVDNKRIRIIGARG